MQPLHPRARALSHRESDASKTKGKERRGRSYHSGCDRRRQGDPLSLNDAPQTASDRAQAELFLTSAFAEMMAGLAMDWQHQFERFREGRSRLPELDRRHVAQCRVDPEVVVPVHVIRELGSELARPSSVLRSGRRSPRCRGRRAGRRSSTMPRRARRPGRCIFECAAPCRRSRARRRSARRPR